MKIQAMLNPSDTTSDTHDSSPNGSPDPPYRAYSHPRSTPKPDKMPKDGFISVKGEPKGTVRYPPHEIHQDQNIGPQLDKFQVRPDKTMGKFIEYPRYIPYTSAKRGLQEKTGLKGFHVFQYEFLVQNEGSRQAKKHLVLWDYNVGLVRITPFFKALNYSKTTPKRVLDINNGLGELTVSITGGALAAQGYWMPFECAKALACTFCYHIRHLLTPIFGPDFLEECLSTEDPAYGSFKIDRAIIQQCTADTSSLHLLRRCDTPQSGVSSPPISPHTDTTNVSAPSTPFLHRSRRPQRPKAHRNHISEDGSWSDLDRCESASSNNVSPEVSPKTVPIGSKWVVSNQTVRPGTPGPGMPIELASAMNNPFNSGYKSGKDSLEEVLDNTNADRNKLGRVPSQMLMHGPGHAKVLSRKSSEHSAYDYHAASILMQLSNDEQASKLPPVASSSPVWCGSPYTQAAGVDSVAARLESMATKEDRRGNIKKRAAEDAFVEAEGEIDVNKHSRKAFDGA